MSDEKQPDTYLKQLADEADMAGTYLSGVSGTSSGPQHVDGDRIRTLVERAAAWTQEDLRRHPTLSLELIDTLSDTLAELALPSPTHSAPALTSGDGSESAGLRSVQNCHAGSDGDCSWDACPQEANNRANYQTVCPLYRENDDE